MGVILRVKTIKSFVIIKLIEALKDILSEINFIFTKTGITATAIDETKVTIIYLSLQAQNFCDFLCKEEKIVVGINVNTFFKIIKTMNTQDVLTFEMTSDRHDKLQIIMENDKKNSRKVYTINLMDMDTEEVSFNPTTMNTKFNSVISMPTNDFQKLCKDFSIVSKDIEITSTHNQLQFTSTSVSTKSEMFYYDIDDGDNTSNKMSFIKKDENPNMIAQGIYSLSHLLPFSKCSPLCNNVEIYLKNNYALLVKYACADLGSVWMCLAPRVKARNN